MSDGIVIIGRVFCGPSLVKNIRKQDPNILADPDRRRQHVMSTTNRDLSHVVSRGQNAGDLTLQRRASLLSEAAHENDVTLVCSPEVR